LVTYLNKFLSGIDGGNENGIDWDFSTLLSVEFDNIWLFKAFNKTFWSCSSASWIIFEAESGTGLSF